MRAFNGSFRGRIAWSSCPFGLMELPSTAARASMHRSAALAPDKKTVLCMHGLSREFRSRSDTLPVARVASTGRGKAVIILPASPLSKEIS